MLLRFGLDGSIGPTPDNPSGEAPPSSWWQVLSVFTFTQNYTGGSATLPIGQAWSLDVEVAFYIAIPIAAAIAFTLVKPLKLKTPRARAIAALAFIGFLTLFSIALRQDASNNFAALTSPPLIVWVFLPGRRARRHRAVHRPGVPRPRQARAPASHGAASASPSSRGCST